MLVAVSVGGVEVEQTALRASLGFNGEVGRDLWVYDP